jgi:hypothetical protein
MICSHWDLSVALTELVAPFLRKTCTLAESCAMVAKPVKSRSFEQFVVDDYVLAEDESPRAHFSRFRSPKSVVWTFLFPDQYIDASDWCVSSRLDQPFSAVAALLRFGATVHVLQSNCHVKLWNPEGTHAVWQSVVSQHRRARKHAKGPLPSQPHELEKLFQLMYDPASDWPHHARKNSDLTLCVHLPSEEALGPCLDPFHAALQSLLPATTNLNGPHKCALLQDQFVGQVFVSGVRLSVSVPFSFGFSFFDPHSSDLELRTIVLEVLKHELADLEDAVEFANVRQQNLALRLLRDLSTPKLPLDIPLRDLEFLKAPLTLANRQRDSHSLLDEGSQFVPTGSVLDSLLSELRTRERQSRSNFVLTGREQPNRISSDEEEDSSRPRPSAKLCEVSNPSDAETEPPSEDSSENDMDRVSLRNGVAVIQRKSFPLPFISSSLIPKQCSCSS